MDLSLSDADRALQARARAFTDEVLVPLEDECEANDGLSPESHARAKREILDRRFHAINHAVADGGQGHDLFEQMLIEEQWGRATGALWDLPWRPSIPLASGTEEQKERYLRPACRGERRDAYAITEEGAGSDPTMVATTATRDGDDWLVRGEKWHVTSGDVADFFLVHAHVDGDPAKATIFLVDKEAPGVRLVRTPRYMHTFVFEHPIFAFESVRVGDDAVLGEVNGGWKTMGVALAFERGVMGGTAPGVSLLRHFRQWADGGPLMDDPLVRSRLARIAIDNEVASLLTQRAAWIAASGGLPGLEGSMAKVFATESYQKASAWLLAAAGPAGLLSFKQPGAAADGWIEYDARHSPVTTIYGGTSEINRNNIAERHLGLPKARK
jgi:alkylation response protein AidB-like acyl-CoA dehydrogenase